MKVRVSIEYIIEKYSLSYSQINSLTKKGVLRVTGKRENKRLYNLQEIDRKLKDRDLRQNKGE